LLTGPTPPLFVAAVGVTPLEFYPDLWRNKTRIPELLYGVVCVILDLAILEEYGHVADRQTDRPTRTTYHPVNGRGYGHLTVLISMLHFFRDITLPPHKFLV